MEITKSKCNTCKIEVPSGKEPPRWIQIRTPGGSFFASFVNLSVKMPVDSDRPWNSVVEKRLDFCCPACLAIYVEKMAHQTPKAKKKKKKGKK